MKHTFNSYEEINKQLEILNIEREISFHRLTESTSEISNSITVPNLLKLGFSSLGNSIGKSSQFRIFIVTTILKFFIKKIFKRK